MKVIVPNPIVLNQTNVTASAEAEWCDLITSTSTTSVAIATGPKTFTTDTDLEYVAGCGVLISSDADPSTQNMTGTITSYDADDGTLIVEVASVTGTATRDDWTITTTDYTYELDDLVKVSTEFPVNIYKSLRTNNIGRFPPDNLEPSVESAKSTSSIAVETGSKNFTIAAGKNFSAGMMVKISHSVTPNSYHMTGEVTAYTSTTLTVNVTSVTGEGTFASWSIVSVDEIGFWEEVGAANQHKMFDPYVNTKTVNPTSIEVRLESERADSFALFGVTGTRIEAELWNPDLIDLDWDGTPRIIEPSPPVLEDTFGSSVALSYDGYTLYVGVPNHDSGLQNVGRVLVYTYGETGWKYSSVINHPFPAAGSRFGAAVSVSEDGLVLAIGSCPIADGVNQSGQIYTYELESGVWVLKDYIYAPPSDDWLLTEAGTPIQTEEEVALFSDAINDWFGTSVSLSSDGQLMATGAPRLAEESVETGKVFVFSRYFESWNLSDTISTTNTETYFGYSVALSSDGLVLAIGEPYNSDTASEAGAVSIYDTGWTLRGTIESSDLVADDHFGSAVSLTSDGAKLLVGACGQDDANTDTGKVYLFDWDDPSWVESEDFVPADGRDEDRYGSAACIASGGGVIAIGSPMWDTGSLNTGKVYAYHPPVPYWSDAQELIYGSLSSLEISDWFEYFFGEFSVKEDIHFSMGNVPYDGLLLLKIIGETGVDVTCGTVVLGRSQDLGKTQFGASIGMLDFSQRTTDDYGRTTITQGNWAKTNDLTLYLPNNKVDSVYRKVTSIRSIPTAWIANNEEYDDNQFESFLVYGIFKDFSVTVAGPSHSWCDLNIEGLI
jgi:hypothetical protein